MAERIDFNDLLKWSLKHQAEHPDDPETDRHRQIQQMSDADREFLLDAMDQSVMDEQKRVKILMRVLRFPEDPELLYKLKAINNGETFQLLKDKENLRSLLEMRQEDTRRKAAGQPVIGAEYIPSNYVSCKEVLEQRLQQQQKQQSTTLSPQQLQEQLDTTLQSLLSTIPTPTTQDLQRVYSAMRDEKLDALEEIEDRTFRADTAVGFVTHNGLPLLKHYLLSNDFEMASICFRLLGNIVSNEAFCQQKAIEYKLIPLAIEAMNITRFIPYLIADYNTVLKMNTDDDEEDTADVVERKNKIQQVCQDYLQNNPNIGQTVDHYLPNKRYTKHIMSLIKSVIYFLTSLCNNNSTAQTQFVQYHGIACFSYLLDLGTLLSPQSTQYKTYQMMMKDTKTITTQNIFIELFYQLITAQKGVFKQTIRRAIIFLKLLIDVDYKISTSPQIYQQIMSIADQYNTITTTPPKTDAQQMAQYSSFLSLALNKTTTTSTQSQSQQQAQLDVDEGKDRSYFKDPIAPFIVEGGMHPAFKLKNNRHGGNLSADGSAVDPQVSLHGLMTILLPHALPVSSWPCYLEDYLKIDPITAYHVVDTLAIVLSTLRGKDKHAEQLNFVQDEVQVEDYQELQQHWNKLAVVQVLSGQTAAANVGAMRNGVAVPPTTATPAEVVGGSLSVIVDNVRTKFQQELKEEQDKEEQRAIQDRLSQIATIQKYLK